MGESEMNNIFAMIAIVAIMTTTAFAGPTEYHEYGAVVGPDSSHTYVVDVVGDGWATDIRLYGSCETPQHDIDLWVYEGNRLLAKETGNGCEHQIIIDTMEGRYGQIRIVVENEQKPYNTAYQLIVE